VSRARIVDPNNLPPAGAFAPPPGMGYGAVPGVAIPMTMQATRHARRIYVGGVPLQTNEAQLATFFNNALIAINGTNAEEGAPVVNVYINQEKKFSFVEFRSVEEASNALALDGVIIDGAQVRIRRPNDYNSQLAIGLGPSTPNPNLDLAAIGLDQNALGTTTSANILQEHEDRIFIGGLPYFLDEAQVRELLEAFGPIAKFDLVRDKENGNSKGYGFVVYQDVSVTDIACQGLNGMQMGDKTLTVRRAEDKSAPGPMMNVPPPPPAIAPPSANPPSMVVSFDQMGVTAEELADDEEYENIMEDMQEECGKYGKIVAVVIPRPSKDGSDVPGMGKVFVQYASVDGAMAARTALNGRKFGGSTVIADFLDEADFHARKF
jgi:splicing factor U2AF 65 kDa subunit